MTSSSTISGRPPTALATTGRPWALASMADKPAGSCQREGTTTARDPSISARMSTASSQPWKRTRSDSPLRVTFSRRRGSAGPTPAKCSTEGPSTAANASSNHDGPFASTIRPMKTNSAGDDPDIGTMGTGAGAGFCSTTIRSSGYPARSSRPRTNSEIAMRAICSVARSSRVRLNASMTAWGFRLPQPSII